MSSEIYRVLSSLNEGESVLFEHEEDMRLVRNCLYYVRQSTGLIFVRKRFAAGLRVWQHGTERTWKREPKSETRFTVDAGFPMPSASERKSRSYKGAKLDIPVETIKSDGIFPNSIYAQIKEMEVGDVRYFGAGNITNARIYASRIGKIWKRKYRTTKNPDNLLMIERWK